MYRVKFYSLCVVYDFHRLNPQFEDKSRKRKRFGASLGFNETEDPLESLDFVKANHKFWDQIRILKKFGDQH